jgi:fatty acid desaturase
MRNEINRPVNLKALKEYQSELKRILPKKIFKPAPERLVWFFIHQTIIVLCCWLIITTEIFFLKIGSSIIIGNSLATLGFLGHEIIHGTVVQGRRLIYILGTLCMWQWGLHAKAWLSWHNFDHHNNTQHPFEDPDCFGRVEMYDHNWKLRVLERLAPGSGGIFSVFFLFWYFSFQTAWVVLFNLKSINRKRDKLEAKMFLLLVNIGWPLITLFVSPLGWLYLWFIPLATSNLIFMSYIATNHFLNPLTTDENDPLVNSLTVRSFKWLEWLHLNNCYHTEHHVLPYVNPKYAPIVSNAIKTLWPEKYCEMNHFKALKYIYIIPKVYHNDVTHIDLKTRRKIKNIFLG